MGEPRRPRIPDPSATIPDFGPRPDLKTLEKRAEVMKMLEKDAAPPALPPPPRKTNPLLVLVIAVFVAVLAGSAGFFVMVFAGLAIYWILGL